MNRKSISFHKISFKLTRFLVGVFLLLSWNGNILAELQLSLEVDRNEVTLEDQIEVKVSVIGDHEIRDMPELKNVGNFTVHSSGSSSQISIINGVSNSKKIYHFTLIPEKEGTFTIGPAQIEIGQKSLTSDQVEIKVGPTEKKEVGDRLFFIVAEISDKNPYINQQILYTFKFYRRVPITNATLKLPEFDNFWKEELEGEKEYRTVINGIPWQVSEVKLALFPNSSGKFIIQPAQLQASLIFREERRMRSLFDSFFDSGHQIKQIHPKTDPIEVNVRPLPEIGRPSNFSGLVGKFKLHADIGQKALAVGDSTTLTLKLEGHGNIHDAKLPDFNLNATGMKTYDDKPESRIVKNYNGVSGSKIFKKALVPTRQGPIEIPVLSLSYFDPLTQSYQSAEIGPFMLEVLPGSGSEKMENFSSPSSPSSGSLKKGIQVIGEDLMPLMRGENILHGPKASKQEKFLLTLFSLLGPLLFFPLFMLQRRKQIFEHDPLRLQKEKAFKRFQKEFSELTASTNIFGDLANLLRNYLGDKFGLEGKALTPLDVGRKLGPFLPLEIIQEVQEYLKECDAGQFSGVTYKHDERERFKERLLALIKRIQKEKPL